MMCCFHFQNLHSLSKKSFWNKDQLHKFAASLNWSYFFITGPNDKNKEKRQDFKKNKSKPREMLRGISLKKIWKVSKHKVLFLFEKACAVSSTCVKGAVSRTSAIFLRFLREQKMATTRASVAEIRPSWQLGQLRNNFTAQDESSKCRFPRPCLVSAIIFPIETGCQKSPIIVTLLL